MARWYSSGLDEQTVAELPKFDARFRNIIFGLQNYEDIVELDRKKGMPLELSLDLEFRLGNGIINVTYATTDFEEIKDILAVTDSRYIHELEGKSVTAYLNSGRSALRGISLE